MRRIPFVSAALALTLATAGCAAEEGPSVTTDHPIAQQTLEQVHALQGQIRDHGEQVMALIASVSPNPGTVRIGPAPCPGVGEDFAADGAYYVSGAWQLPLSAQEQISTIEAVRAAWQAEGYRIVSYRLLDNDTRARLEAEDPATGFTLTIASTVEATGVAIRIVSACVTPPDRRYPSQAVTIYQ